MRREAIDLTKRGIDAARAMGTDLMTVWLGQDGFDYNFQLDYGQVWDWEVAGIREIAEHDPGCRISIEYKPDEPRAHSLLAGRGHDLACDRRCGCIQPRRDDRLRPRPLRG